MLVTSRFCTISEVMIPLYVNGLKPEKLFEIPTTIFRAHRLPEFIHHQLCSITKTLVRYLSNLSQVIVLANLIL